MGTYVKKYCPTCKSALTGFDYWTVRPGQKIIVECPKCKVPITLQDDPSFSDASAPRKAFYGVAFIFTFFKVFFLGFIGFKLITINSSGLFLIVGVLMIIAAIYILFS